MNHLCYINGDILSATEARLPINDLGITRGYSLFDYCRTYNGKIFMLEMHLDRLFSSAEQMRLQIPLSKDDIKNIVLDLHQRIDLKELAFRFLLTGGLSLDSLTSEQASFIIQTENIPFDFPAHYPNGIHIITANHLRELPTVKSTNYLRLMLLRKDFIALQVQDVLYTHHEKVLELSRSNIFLAKNGKLITPKNNILCGITRRVVLQLAENIYCCEERDIAVDELWTADEIFTTGTGKRVLSVTKIDGRVVGDGQIGPVTQAISHLFDDYCAMVSASV